MFSKCDFRPDLEIIRNPIENERYRLVERPNMLFSFNNIENEKHYAFTKIGENKSSDFFANCICTIVGDTLIYFIADSKNMPAWA